MQKTNLIHKVIAAAALAGAAGCASEDISGTWCGGGDCDNDMLQISEQDSFVYGEWCSGYDCCSVVGAYDGEMVSLSCDSDERHWELYPTGGCMVGTMTVYCYGCGPNYSGYHYYGENAYYLQ